MFNPLHSISDQELFEKHLCNQNSHYENTDDFHYEGKPSRATTKSTLFAVSKDEWDTKEDTGKSMKNTLYVLQYAKSRLVGIMLKIFIIILFRISFKNLSLCLLLFPKILIIPKIIPTFYNLFFSLVSKLYSKTLKY